MFNIHCLSDAPKRSLCVAAQIESNVFSSGKGNAFPALGIELVVRSLRLIRSVTGMEVILVADPINVTM